MFRRILDFFGFDIIYFCEWGEYTHRYDGIDYTMGRPIHKNMSIAPPWAKIKIVER